MSTGGLITSDCQKLMFIQSSCWLYRINQQLFFLYSAYKIESNTNGSKQTGAKINAGSNDKQLGFLVKWGSWEKEGK